ncbi:hypothetical protein [Bacillus sp. FJAT-44742]|uniref:hypothetical protein n=1 Tax=Bacillus sp. FJAT-44742 TaxID=2014005 RepID=UPI000C23C2A0|nr:hypothetical protein [Bacillus sp. FJAT-44742]
MNIDYSTIFNSLPEEKVLVGIIDLHKNIFGTSDDLITKMRSKQKLLVITAMDGTKVIGYKIGYELDMNIDEKGLHKIILEKKLLN